MAPECLIYCLRMYVVKTSFEYVHRKSFGIFKKRLQKIKIRPTSFSNIKSMSSSFCFIFLTCWPLSEHLFWKFWTLGTLRSFKRWKIRKSNGRALPSKNADWKWWKMKLQIMMINNSGLFLSYKSISQILMEKSSVFLPHPKKDLTVQYSP